jgi:hypothetical protein
MRWLLALLAVLLLLWLASGDARAWAPAPAQDIWAARLESPAPGVAGVWVTLAPDACGPNRFLEARFLYGGRQYGVEAPLPPCPSPPVFLGRTLPPLPAGVPAVASQAFVLESGPGSPASDAYVQRYPGDGFLPDQPLGRPAAGPALSIALSAADVAVVAGVWAQAWWRDPSRPRLRAPCSQQSLGR